MSNQSQPQIEDKKKHILELIKEVQEHQTEQAQHELVVHYTPLVQSIARKYGQGKYYAEDVKQVGMLGLLGAIKRYDVTMGKSFEAFAIPTIMGEIKRFLRDKTWSVHVPRRIKEIGPKIKSAVESLTTTLQRSPQIKEIAEYLEVTEEEVLEAMEMGQSYHALSMDHSIDADDEGGSVTLLDIVGKNDDDYEKVDQRLVLEKVLHVLTDREREVIQLTYLDQLSQKETGEKLNISQMHVSRLQRKAIQKLQQAIQAEKGS